MFAAMSRSWEFARMSYSMLRSHKHLLIFPMASTVAAILVLASFVLPLFATGTLMEWVQFMDEEAASEGDIAMYATAFAFYFCSYFVIVFFNTGLIACVLKIMNEGRATVGYGMSFALKRLPQILGWALLSAFIGVLLKAIENSNKRVGRIISAILGSAWTALAYFVAPVIVVEGAGPVAAFKRSTAILRQTWGTGDTIPEGIDTYRFDEAFRPRK